MFLSCKYRLAIAAAACGFALLSAGCGKSLDQQLVGKWKAKLPDKVANSNKPEDQMAKAMAQSMMSTFTLELKPDKTFTMTMMMFPVEGKWSVSGNTVQLAPEKVMGMSADQVKSKNPNAKVEAMRFTASPDGKQLIPIDDKSSSKKTNMEMVFVKDDTK
jgi:hypothetical protein